MACRNCFMPASPLLFPVSFILYWAIQSHKMTTPSSPYYQHLQPGMAVQQMLLQHAAQLQDLQQIVFPTLTAEEWIKAEQFLKHLTIFPEGQFVIINRDEVIGMTSCMRANFSTEYHTFKEISAGGWFTNYNPEGDWLYRLDMGVHPEQMGPGIGKTFIPGETPGGKSTRS